MRKVYGQDAMPNTGQAVQININLRGSAAERTINDLAAAAEPQTDQ
jgi:hypothetical protein